MVHAGSLGLPEQAPFDRIIVTAAAEDTPKGLLEQLREGGIMVLPVGPSNPVQTSLKVVETARGPIRLSGAVRFVLCRRGSPARIGRIGASHARCGER